MSDNPATDPATKVTLQLDVIGLNHPPQIGCALGVKGFSACECDFICCDKPMADDALFNLSAALANDWRGTSQVLVMTGLRPQALPCGNYQQCGSFDDCFINGPGSQFGFSSHHANASVSDKWGQRELAVLTTSRWRATAEDATTIDLAPTSGTGSPKPRGLYHVRLEDTCDTHLAVSVFAMHFELNDEVVRKEQMAAALAYIQLQSKPDEYAPLFAGDFNGLDVSSSPDATAAFTELDLCGGQQCRDGALAGRSFSGANSTMKILLGKDSCDSPFRNMPGAFSPVRQSAIEQTFAAGAQQGGIPVAGIAHTLAGAGLVAVPRAGACAPGGPACGSAGQGCINGSGCLSSEMSCQAGVCRSCGKRAQACCPGAACVDGASCVDGKCQTKPGCPPGQHFGPICWKEGDPPPPPKPPCKQGCVPN